MEGIDPMLCSLAFTVLTITNVPSADAVIVADIANLRGAPSPSAPVIARLHIDTPVAVLDRKPGWLRVHPFDASGPRADVTGWIAAELVGDRVDEGALFAQYDEAIFAKDTKRAVTWARRIVAFNGAQRENVERLHAALLADGDTKGAAAITRRLAGDEPIYFAQCALKSYEAKPMWRAVLLAVDDGKRIKPLSGEQMKPEEIAKLSRTLEGYRWFSQSGPLAGSPFITPFGGALWNDATGVRPPQPGKPLTELGDDAPAKLVLGPCDPRHAGILATSPLVAAEDVRGVPLERALKSVDALVRAWKPEANGAHAGTTRMTNAETVLLFDEMYAFTSITMRATWAGHHDDEVGPRSVFTVVDHDGRIVVTPQMWAGEGAAWVKLPFGGRSLGVLPRVGHDEGDANGAIFLVPRAKSFEAITVVTDQYGC